MKGFRNMQCLHFCLSFLKFNSSINMFLYILANNRFDGGLLLHLQIVQGNLNELYPPNIHQEAQLLQYYCYFLALFFAALRQIKPNYLFIFTEFNQIASYFNQNYMQLIIGIIARLIEAVVFHSYPCSIGLINVSCLSFVFGSFGRAFSGYCCQRRLGVHRKFDIIIGRSRGREDLRMVELLSFRSVLVWPAPVQCPVPWRKYRQRVAVIVSRATPAPRCVPL